MEQSTLLTESDVQILDDLENRSKNFSRIANICFAVNLATFLATLGQMGHEIYQQFVQGSHRHTLQEAIPFFASVGISGISGLLAIIIKHKQNNQDDAIKNFLKEKLHQGRSIEN